MSKRAWVTLATNDSYSLGALVLAHSLHRVGSAYPAVVMITPSVTQLMRERLSTIFSEVIMVDVLDSEDAAHLALLARPELGITFTKLHCWNLTQFEKAVFLDADTLVLQKCDELFEREELSAAPDVGWPDCFNSGVFVFQPSSDTFQSLLKFAREQGSFDGGDQGLLNMYFSTWATADISKHLPFLYNVCSAAFYSYLPALKQYGQNMKIMHFIGNAKPWLQNFNWGTRSVQNAGVGGAENAGGHLQPTLQLWWDIFCSDVHPHLDSTMAMYDSEHTLHESRAPDPARYQPTPDPLSLFPWHQPDIEPQRLQEPLALAQFYDPWDNYRGEIAPSPLNNTHPTHYSPELSAEEANCAENTLAYNNGDHHHNYNNHNQNDHENRVHRDSYEHYDHDNRIDNHNHNNNNEIHEQCISHSNHVNEYNNDYHGIKDPDQRECSISHDSHQFQEPLHIQIHSESDCFSQTSESAQYESPLPSPVVEVGAPKPRHPYDNFYMNHRPVIDKSGCKRCSHEVVACPSPSVSPSLLSPGNEEDNAQAGLAGTFSQLSLGAATSGPQVSLDLHTRRQGWESGNIDYMGADAFDNIWARISQTLTSPQPPQSGTPSDASSSSITEERTTKTIEKVKQVVSAPVEHKPVVGILKTQSALPPVQVEVENVSKKTSDTPTTPVASGKQESIATHKSVTAVVSSTTPLVVPVSEPDTKTADEQKAPVSRGPEAQPSPARKPKGKLMCHLRAAPEPIPLLTPDSEFEDAASLAQSIIASELTPTVTSPTPPALCSPPLLPQLTKDLSVDSTVPETPPAKGPVSLAHIGILTNTTVKVEAPANVIQQVNEVLPISKESAVNAQVAPISSSVDFIKENRQGLDNKASLDFTNIEVKPVESISPFDKMIMQTKAETPLVNAGESSKLKKCSAVGMNVETKGFGNDEQNMTNLSNITSSDSNIEAASIEQVTAPRRPKIKKLPKEPKEELSNTHSAPTLAGIIAPPVPPPRKKEKKPKETK